ncbi:MAG: polysaccharide biosynthesis C-terminal domain-containing protein, partial [Bacteroidales bacterium]
TIWSLVATSSIFLLLVFLFNEPIGQLLGYEHAATYIIWFAFILVADSLSAIPFCLLREQNKAFRFALLKTLNIAVNIGLNLFFILYCPAHLEANPDSWIASIYDPSLGIAYIFIANLLASLFTFFCLFPEWKQLRFRFSSTLWKDMMAYALPVMVWGMAGIVNGTFDRILLRYLLPDPAVALSQLGIYGACYKLSIIMTLFVQAFRFAAEPFFFKQAEAKDAKETYAQVMKYFVITCAFIYLVCVLFLDWIMYFVGSDYREGASVVPVLLMANLFLGIFYNLSVWYKVSDRTKIGMYISLIGAALTIGLNFLLIPYFGYHGAAWTAFLCYFLISVISYIWGQKYYRIPYSLKRIAFYIGLVLIIGGIKNFIPLQQPWFILLYALVGISVFVLVILKKEPDLKHLVLKIVKKNDRSKSS